MTHEELYAAARIVTPTDLNLSVTYELASYKYPQWCITSSKVSDPAAGVVVWGETPLKVLAAFLQRMIEKETEATQ